MTFVMEILVVACLLGSGGTVCDKLQTDKSYDAASAKEARIACLLDNRVVANVWASTRPDHLIQEYKCTVKEVRTPDFPRPKPE